MRLGTRSAAVVGRGVELERLLPDGPWRTVHVDPAAGRLRARVRAARWLLLGRAPAGASRLDGPGEGAGGAGMREPRRPRPSAGSATALADRP